MDESPDRTKPVLIYDGDCGFCRAWIARWRAITGDAVTYRPYQEVADEFPDIAPDRFAREAHLIEPDGAIHRGAQAVFHALARVPGKRRLLWMYDRVPGFAPISQWCYRRVANNRRLLSGVTCLFWGCPVPPSGLVLSRWLFLRLLSLIYLIAFLSLGVQITGLVGEQGILPAGRFLDVIHHQLGLDAYWKFPTLAWLSHGDLALHLFCWMGAGASILAFLRIAPAPMLLLAWILYLSLFHVGQTFLHFQWDILLLETGFLAVFFAPWKLWPRLGSEPRPSRMVHFLLVLLFFRLMFSSGVVKLLDDNPTGQEWHHLTALSYHYETQCIPNPIAWYAHQLPAWFHEISVVGMFLIEIPIALLFFLPRRMRIVAFFFQLLLQLLILATGNYGFFNLLAVALAVLLLDDAFLKRLVPGFVRRLVEPGSPRAGPIRVQRLIIFPLVLLILLLNAIWMVDTLRRDRRHHIFSELPESVLQLMSVVGPFQLVHSYGLFRSMTTRRPEIIVEGSRDGRVWESYEFKYKPGALDRRAPFVAPHQPRLDWQMWFAALGDYRSRRDRWFVAFAQRLLEGSPEVVALLGRNPFGDKPPRYIRAILYDYHYTTREEREKTGNWWKRKRLRQYLPTISLSSFRQE